MAMERFDDDLNIIAGLGDDPKRDDGLSTQGFKSIFDKAGLLIQDFINNKLIPFIEKQNVGLPLGGGTMEGPINMNGQSISGLNSPTKDDEPATKGYADNLKPNLTGYATEAFVKETISNRTVNNFTTTEEGFIADARALKYLNDKKLSMDLLWENASTSSSFETQTVAIDLSNYSQVYIKTAHGSETAYRTLRKYSLFDKNETSILAHYNDTHDGSANLYNATRVITVSDTGIEFSDALLRKVNTSDVTNPTVDNKACIPLKIYGIKGVSV